MAHTKVPGNTYLPVVLIDVDGVLSLYGRDLDTRAGGRWLNVDGILHFLSAAAAEHPRDIGINPYGVGAIAIAILSVLMLTLLSFGKGREHS